MTDILPRHYVAKALRIKMAVQCDGHVHEPFIQRDADALIHDCQNGAQFKWIDTIVLGAQLKRTDEMFWAGAIFGAAVATIAVTVWQLLP